MQVQTSIGQTRNLGILAHIDAGKTTTTERILFYSGVSPRLGEVDDGTAVTDWLPEEAERGISINSAAITFKWKGHHCNLIDTPGHVDFTIEVERALRVLDGVVTVFCAVAGVESQTETVWRQADRYRVPRIAFINKCDRVGSDPARVAEEIRQRLRANPIVVQYPHGLESEFNGLVDLVRFRSMVWDDTLGLTVEDREVPKHLQEEAQLARDLMLEALAECDDQFMATYLARKEFSPEEVIAALRRATIELRAVPVLLGAALRNKGVQPLLDAIVDFLPSPADLPPAAGIDPRTGEPVTRRAGDQEPTAALAFKVMTHDVGQLTYLRVYSGAINSGDQLLDSTRHTRVRVGRLVRVLASEYEVIDRLGTGDIGAAVKLRSTKTGDTLCDPTAPIVLDRMEFPEPVIGVSIEPATDKDATRLSEGLEQLSIEDPTFRVRTDPETQQTIISGMGELHLEVLVDRLAREFEVQAVVGKPQVAYRETVTAPASLERTYDRRMPSGRGQFAQIHVKLQPRPRGSGFTFDNEVPYDKLPKEFVNAVQSGVKEASERGVLGGFPLTDIGVTLAGGLAHPVDSTEAAFKTAGLQAFREAARSARPALLEPLMEVSVYTPEDYIGEVVSDLNARRGKITGIEARSGVQVVTCLVPLAAMFGYATDLRSRTQGRATFSMQFVKYTEVPSGITEQIVARVMGA